MVTKPELDNLIEKVPQQNPTVKLELSVNEVNVVFAALQELPHRVVDLLLKKMIQQVQVQLQQ